MTGARIVAILIAITIATVANISCGSKPVSLEVSRCFPVCRRKRTPYPNVSAWSAASLFRTRPWRTRGVEEAKGSLRSTQNSTCTPAASKMRTSLNSCPVSLASHALSFVTTTPTFPARQSAIRRLRARRSSVARSHPRELGAPVGAVRACEREKAKIQNRVK